MLHIYFLGCIISMLHILKMISNSNITSIDFYVRDQRPVWLKCHSQNTKTWKESKREKESATKFKVQAQGLRLAFQKQKNWKTWRVFVWFRYHVIFSFTSVLVVKFDFHNC